MDAIARHDVHHLGSDPNAVIDLEAAIAGSSFHVLQPSSVHLLGRKLIGYCVCVGFGLACRNIGPVDGERPAFFGHLKKAPKTSDRLPFHPQRDVRQGVTVAIHMADEDANVWARIFDIGICTEVVDPDDHNGYDVRHFRVQLFACRGVLPDCPPNSLEFRTEEVQLNMQWYRTVETEVIPWTAVISEQWVDGRGYLFPEWRENLRRALPRYHALDPYEQ